MVTNVNRASGLKVVGSTRGAGYNCRISEYYVPASDATAIYIGDAVKSAGSADTQTGRPTITQAAAGDTLRGVVVGINPIKGVAVGSENLNRNYRPASTAMYLLVCDDPDAVFEIQDDSVGGAYPVTAIGENADLVVGSGNTGTSISGMQLDTSTHTTSSAQLRTLGFVEQPNNYIGVANAKLLVKINEHELASTTGV